MCHKKNETGLNQSDFNLFYKSPLTKLACPFKNERFLMTWLDSVVKVKSFYWIDFRCLQMKSFYWIDFRCVHRLPVFVSFICHRSLCSNFTGIHQSFSNRTHCYISGSGTCCVFRPEKHACTCFSMLLNNEKTQKLLKVPFLIMRTVIFHTISLSLFRYFAQRVCVCVCTLFLLYFPFGEIKNLFARLLSCSVSVT